MLNGGYIMVSKTDTNIYEKVNKALTLGKPILWYEDETTCYYIDTISKSGTDVILTKGGKTITIEADGDITETGEILNSLMENIKDKDGNLRFIEGTGIVHSLLTNAYAKWSLSGSHLMIVLSAVIPDETVLDDQTVLFNMTSIPTWVLDKIVPVASNIIEIKDGTAYGTDLTSQSTSFRLMKGTGIYINQRASFTATADRTFRIQFDLLIDVD